MTTVVRQIGTLSLPTDAEDGQVLGWTGSGWGPVDQAAGAGTVTSINGVTPVSGAVTLAKSDIGLGNVDNTSDANKPVSTAASTALALKAPIANPTFTGTVAGVTKAHVGLGNVDNTADNAKPVSTAQQTALDLKAPLASPAFTGTPTGITKTHVGLGNVDNTADSAKPVSTAAQTALDLKAPLASPAFTGTPTGITKTHVGLGNVDNTADTAKPVSTAQQTALDLKASLASPSFTGTPLVPTATGSTNNTQAASTAFVKTAIGSLALSSASQTVEHRNYTSGAWQLLGTIPDNATVIWIGPVSVGLPPVGGGYARAGDPYYGTEG